MATTTMMIGEMYVSAESLNRLRRSWSFRRWYRRAMGRHDIYSLIAANPEHALPRNARKNGKAP